MDVVDAIRKRRAVRRYTDRPIPEGVLDRILRMALAAPTGSGAQAWGLTVVREPELRRQIAELVIAGGGRYFAIMRPRAEGATDEEHVAWGREYAEQILGSYRQVPAGCWARWYRGHHPASMREGALDDVIRWPRDGEPVRGPRRGHRVGPHHGLPAIREGPPPGDPGHAARGRSGDPHAPRVPRSVPRGPASGPQADVPTLADARARRTMGKHTRPDGLNRDPRTGRTRRSSRGPHSRVLGYVEPQISVGTVATSDYIPWSRVLAESVAEHNPGSRLRPDLTTSTRPGPRTWRSPGRVRLALDDVHHPAAVLREKVLVAPGAAGAY